MSSLDRSNTRASDGRRKRHGRSARVLLAEDNEDSRRVYSLILRHYGYTVKEAENGAEAVEMTRVMRPDLVLMDIGLPVLDGWEASRILKRAPETRDIPLIAFSARVESSDDLEAETTFDGFIRKPISPTELVDRVDDLVARFEERDTIGEISFDEFGTAAEFEDPDAQLSA